MDLLDMLQLYDEFIDAEDLIDKLLVYQNKRVDTKYRNASGEVEMNSFKSQALFLLVSTL